MSKRGVPVFNAPGANANAVKELVIAAMLLAARNVVPAAGFVQALRAWRRFRGARRARQEAVRRLRAARAHARRHRPGRDRRPGGRHRHPPRHEGPGLRPGDHGGQRVAASLVGASAPPPSRKCSRAPTSSRCTFRSTRRPSTSSMPSAWPAPTAAWCCSTSRATRSSTSRRSIASLAEKRLRAYVCDFPSERLLGRCRRGRAAAPRRFHRGGRGELRAHGRRPAARLPRAGHDPQRGQFSGGRNGARIAAPHRDRQRQRAQHGRTDFDYDGASRPQHPQHGQQVARGDGVHARRPRQRRCARSDLPHRAHPRRALDPRDSAQRAGA